MEFDALSIRLEDLQENLKAIRNTLVLEVRAVRVSGWGEEAQEFRLSRGGASGSDLRLRPPCGDTLEECTCGMSSPKPIKEGALSAVMKMAANRAHAGGGSSAAHDSAGEGDEDINEVHSRDDGDNTMQGIRARMPRAAPRPSNKRRVLDGDVDADGDSSEDSSGDEEAPRTGKAGGRRLESEGKRPRTDAGCSSLDEIKRQMGKNPVDMESSKNALEEELRAGEEAYRRRGDLPAVGGNSMGRVDNTVSAGGGVSGHALPGNARDISPVKEARSVGRGDRGEGTDEGDGSGGKGDRGEGERSIEQSPQQGHQVSSDRVVR